MGGTPQRAVRAKIGKLAFALLFLPVLGWLIGATIINHFADRYGPDPAAGPGQTYVVARVCHRHGPVSTHGFGFWYQCAADVHHDGAERRTGGEIVNFLTPADLNEQVAIKLEGKGRRAHHVRAADQPYVGWAWLAAPFALLWIFLVYRVARPIVRDISKHLDAIKHEAPNRDVTVVDQRKPWLNWKVQLVLLAFAVIVAVRSTPWAFEGMRNQQLMALAGWAVIALIVGNAVRRLVFGPWVTITPDGIEFGRGLLAWAEIEQLDLTARGVLVVKPRTGRAKRIGRFGDEGATRVHQTLKLFAKAPYLREGDQAPNQRVS